MYSCRCIWMVCNICWLSASCAQNRPQSTIYTDILDITRTPTHAVRPHAVGTTPGTDSGNSMTGVTDTQLAQYTIHQNTVTIHRLAQLCHEKYRRCKYSSQHWEQHLCQFSRQYWILMKQKTMGGGSGISWTIHVHKSFVPCSRQTTTQARCASWCQTRKCLVPMCQCKLFCSTEVLAVDGWAAGRASSL